MKIHHIGYAVSDIPKAVKIFNLLGFREKGNIFTDRERGVNILFLKSEDILLELLSPADKNSPLDNILSKIGPVPYHICFITENIHRKIEGLRRNGFLVIEEPKEAKAIKEKKVSFLYNKDIGIIELIEEV